jgi:excisionase family DNA binding protein
MTEDDDEAITLPVLPERAQFGPPCASASGWRLPMHASPSTEAMPSVLTVDELATLLRVNRKTVYAALSRGEIPGAKRIGATYRIHRDAVLEWLASSQDRVARSRRIR